MTNSTWVVVADAARARIFAVGSGRSSLQELQVLSKPEARLKERELVTDSPGRSFDSAGRGRHGMEPQTQHKEQESIRFAKQIADVLEDARRCGRATMFYLVAPPAFLGLLRSHLKQSVRDLVVAELNKDLTMQSPDEILEQVSRYL